MRHLITTRRINIISTLLVCGFFLMGAAFQYGGIKHDLVDIVTSSSSIILTNASTQVQRLTGSTAQAVHLPDARSLRVGYWYIVSNDSTQTASVYNYNSELVGTISAGNSAPFYLTSLTTTGGPWDLQPGNGSSGGSSGGCYAGANCFSVRTDDASACSSTPCTIDQQYSSDGLNNAVTTFGRSSTGVYAVTVKGSFCNTEPACTATSANVGFIREDSGATTTNIPLNTYNSGGSAADHAGINLMCVCDAP